MLFIDSGEFGCRGWGCVKGHLGTLQRQTNASLVRHDRLSNREILCMMHYRNAFSSHLRLGYALT